MLIDCVLTLKRRIYEAAIIQSVKTLQAIHRTRKYLMNTDSLKFEKLKKLNSFRIGELITITLQLCSHTLSALNAEAKRRITTSPAAGFDEGRHGVNF